VRRAPCGAILISSFVGDHHYTLSPRRHSIPKVKGAVVQQGYGVGRYGAGGYGVCDQSVTIQFGDGTTPDRDALDLVRSIFKKFEPIFP
jgi:hypothetical protein